MHEHKIMVLDLLQLSANSKHNLATEGSPRAFCVVYIMEQLPTNQHTPGDISTAQEIATFHSAVLLSFHILINDSQKPSVHVEGKKKANPSDLPVSRYWISPKIHHCTR